MLLPASAFHNLSTAAGSRPETRVSLVEGASPKHSREGGTVRGLGVPSTRSFIMREGKYEASSFICRSQILSVHLNSNIGDSSQWLAPCGC